jgi:hypothetical protein
MDQLSKIRGKNSWFIGLSPKKKKMMKYPDIYHKMMINHDKP